MQQALRGALTVEQEKEGELATMSLECKRLIGGDDISNDVITLGMCFQCLFHSCSFLLLAYLQNLTAQSTGSHGGIGGGIQITET